MALHGTGTPLGDPIETGALGQALPARGQAAKTVVSIAAVKSCYGHTEGTAGITGAAQLYLCGGDRQMTSCLTDIGCGPCSAEQFQDKIFTYINF